ncbi:MAG: hypothetical protein IJP17_01515 [Clostridia bacterium]|nr:hypothetical protein [Clostridia bacterium]
MGASDKIIGIKIGGEMPLCEHSDAMRRIFMRLVESGAVTFDSFLYPYADSLLLSDDVISGTQGYFFGSHALLWDVGEDMLRRCIGNTDDVTVCTMACDAREIEHFLREGICQPSAGEHLIGGFEALLTGTVRPWAVREHARRFCSLSEHIARMKGLSVLGITGGCIMFSAEEGTDISALPALYTAKTGGVCRIAPQTD